MFDYSTIFQKSVIDTLLNTAFNSSVTLKKTKSIIVDVTPKNNDYLCKGPNDTQIWIYTDACMLAL